MHALFTTAHIVSGGMRQRLRDALARRRAAEGASTLELVILILGLITVATLLVAALTAAVKSRTDQIV